MTVSQCMADAELSLPDIVPPVIQWLSILEPSGADWQVG